jgi:hypothetical protein
MDVWRSLDRGAHPSGDRLSRIAVDRREKIERARILRNTNRGILLLSLDPINTASIVSDMLFFYFLSSFVN